MAKKPSPQRDKLDIIGIDAICDRVARCVTLRTIASDADVGLSTLVEWLGLPDHAEQYARAMAARADVMADDILMIADDAANDVIIDDDGNERTNQEVIARSRLRVDARKWLAGKMAPKKYGEKVTQEFTGADGGPVKTESTVSFDSVAMDLIAKIRV